MNENTNYIIVDEKVCPSVFGKVLEAKRLLMEGGLYTIQEAVNKVGISRSAFYKYRDAVFSFEKGGRGKTAIIAMDLYDVKGLLSSVLNIIAQSGANVLTINQTIPINGTANVTITIERGDGPLSDIINGTKELSGVKDVKILGME